MRVKSKWGRAIAAIPEYTAQFVAKLRSRA
jgi:hypothetical protein